MSDQSDIALTWKQWFKLVNEICWLKLGVSVNDLEDYTWRDMYEVGTEPEEAVEYFMDEFGYDFEED